MRRGPGMPMYRRLVWFFQFELGATFDGTEANLALAASHMGWSKKQIRAVMGILRNRGVLTCKKLGPGKPIRWTIVEKAREAA